MSQFLLPSLNTAAFRAAVFADQPVFVLKIRPSGQGRSNSPQKMTIRFRLPWSSNSATTPPKPTTPQLTQISQPAWT